MKKATRSKEDDKTKSKIGELDIIRESEQRRQEAERRAKDEENRASESDKKAKEAGIKAEEANRRAEEADKKAGRAEIRVEESDRWAEEAGRRAEEANRRAKEADTRAEEAYRWAEAAGRRAEKADRRAEEADRRADEADKKAEKAETMAEKADRRAEEADIRAEEAGGTAEEAYRRAEMAVRRAEDGVRRAQDEHRRAEEQRQITEQANRRAVEERRRADEAVTRADKLKKANDEQWVVRRDDIELTGPEIGRGGWATVSVAKFRGVQVAVKRIHNQIVCRRNKELFHREMQMAARVRHPNLVQFIGATIKGDMMILMEYMSISLRKQLEIDEYFTPNIVKQVSLGIVKALNYLHRDISSANVLLEPLLPPKLWKAKITDYGSVNLVRQLHTENPGSPAYSAPEAATPSQQTTKIDIYSFGVLMLEMLTGQLLAPENRSSLFRQVHHEHLLRLLQRCLSERPTDRPSAKNIMSELL